MQRWIIKFLAVSGNLISTKCRAVCGCSIIKLSRKFSLCGGADFWLKFHVITFFYEIIIDTSEKKLALQRCPQLHYRHLFRQLTCSGDNKVGTTQIRFPWPPQRTKSIIVRPSRSACRPPAGTRGTSRLLANSNALTGAGVGKAKKGEAKVEH